MTDEGGPRRILWIRNGGKHQQVHDSKLYEAVAGVCNVISMQTEEDRFELAWKQASTSAVGFSTPVWRDVGK